MILDNAQEKIYRYNQLCVHYNLVADAVYKARSKYNDLFDTHYLPFLVAALIAFDLGRMMGKGDERRYDPEMNGFAQQLREKLKGIRPSFQHLTTVRLCDVNLLEEQDNIITAYRYLAAGGNDSLNQTGDGFHVGATKLLHFINPELFLIVDSNAARAFRMTHNINYQNTTQPGYSAEKYIKCLELAKADINKFGITAFCSLEDDTPMARIYDKLSFATGSNWP
ncbi:MAG: hypothetical protein HZA13_04930 [Nitrospirae bacterium]|nr:hypothetical protein [Nitrospirota bacterium]